MTFLKCFNHVDTVKVRKRVVAFNVISYIYEFFVCPDDTIVLQLESELFLTIVG